MKAVVITNKEEAAFRYEQALAQGYITFIERRADPERRLASNKFVYVDSDQEVLEKIRLIEADCSIVDQLR